MEKTVPVRRVYLAFLLSGAAALVYEVTWTRALSLVLGSTTYAVSTMLATFMAGLALGAHLGGRLAGRPAERLLFYFGLCELGIGVTGLLSVPLIYGLPRYYLALYRTFHLYPTVFFTFQILLCALVMAVPTTLMGATFPLVSRAITERLEEMGRRVGNAYSFNTVGAVAGSLGAGFLLIPLLGVRGAAFTAGGVNLLVGTVFVTRHRRALALALVLYAAAGIWLWNARRAPTLLSFYSAYRSLGESYEGVLARDREMLEPLFEGDYAEGPLAAYRTRTGHLILQVAGKIEGTGPADVDTTRLLAYLPIAAHPRPERMLVVGLGAGVTLAAAKDHVPETDLVEIHPGVLEVVSRFGPPGVLEGVRIIRNDARNYLLRTERKYDVVSSEPSYPSESVVANLFTREYYELVTGRLSPDGVYCQWMPYFLLTNDDVTMMVKTFASVFPHASLWRVPDGLDLLLLGSREPFVFSPEEIRGRVGKLNTSGEPLTYELSRGPAEVAEIARMPGVPLHTDDRPLLEFRTARNLLVGDLRLLESTQSTQE